MVSIVCLLGAWHLGEVVENKPASSLVVPLGKALNGTLLFGRQVARLGEGWARSGVLAQDSLHDEHKIICSAPTATASGQKQNKQTIHIACIDF